MDKQTLARKIWDSANAMRASGMNATDYKDFILGFIFYKYLSDTETAELIKLGVAPDEFKDVLTPDNEKIAKYCGENIGYYIPYDYLYSTWLEMGFEFTIKTVTDSIRSFKNSISDEYRKVFDKIFDAFEVNFTKLGMSDKEQTKFSLKLVQIVKEIPTDNKGYDTLGFIYEYLVGQFASNAVKKAGEFYTPHEVSLFMAEIVANHLKDREDIQIYDPTCGSGSLLINIGDAASAYLDKNKISYYGQEWKIETYNIARMNLLMRGVSPSQIILRKTENTLGEDWPMFEEGKPETYQLLLVDAVVSNPPYSQHWSPPEPGADRRFDYGLAPPGKADFAFLQHSLYHLKQDGIMAIVLPHGVLFRGNEEYEIRKKLIENNQIDAIIGLPENMFFGTTIQTLVMILKKNRKENDILFVDASRGFVKNGNKNALRMCDVKHIVDTVVKREEIPYYSHRAGPEEIKSNGYNLNIARYVESPDRPEQYDIFATMFGGVPPEELDSLSKYWDVLPSLKDSLFKVNDNGYYDLITDNVKKTVNENVDVNSYRGLFNDKISGLDQYLKRELIDNLDTVNIAQEEDIIRNYLFDTVKDIPLVDKYSIYQLFAEEWVETKSDIEMIRTGGFDEARCIDDVIQIKKSKDGDYYVQEVVGKKGRIIPFDTVQRVYFSEDLESVNHLGISIDEKTSMIEELIESLTPEEREEDFFDDEKGKISEKEAKAYIKANPNEELSVKLKTFLDSDKELKALKKDQKKLQLDLENKTIEKIQGLTDADILVLLEKKWIESIMESILKTPWKIITVMVSEINCVAKKYMVCLKDATEKSAKNSKILSKMLDQLTGSERDMAGIQEFKRLLDD